MTKFFDKLTSLGFALVFLFAFLWVITVLPPETVYEERRPSYAEPTFTLASFLDSSYVSRLEAYLGDATPCRSLLYRLHTAVFSGVLQNPECHGARKTAYGLEKAMPAFDEALISHNLSVVSAYRARLLNAQNAYSVLIPDKSVYTAGDTDYARALSLLSSADGFSLVECRDTLTVDSYFYGDIHIRPECYGDFARRLSEAMGFRPTEGLTVTDGIRARGTLALQYPSEIYDEFCRLEESCGVLAGLTVTAQDGAARLLYAEGALDDPYDLYLGGEAANGVLTLKNPNARAEKRLIVFRDSFARAFAPYLVGDYREIVLVDLRAPKQVIASTLDGYADVECDVLLMVSTHTLFSSRF